jgi:hypothetical protein
MLERLPYRVMVHARGAAQASARVEAKKRVLIIMGAGRPRRLGKGREGM